MLNMLFLCYTCCFSVTPVLSLLHLLSLSVTPVVSLLHLLFLSYTFCFFLSPFGYLLHLLFLCYSCCICVTHVVSLLHLLFLCCTCCFSVAPVVSLLHLLLLCYTCCWFQSHIIDVHVIFIFNVDIVPLGTLKDAIFFVDLLYTIDDIPPYGCLGDIHMLSVQPAADALVVWLPCVFLSFCSTCHLFPALR